MPTSDLRHSVVCVYCATAPSQFPSLDVGYSRPLSAIASELRLVQEHTLGRTVLIILGYADEYSADTICTRPRKG